MTFKFSFYRGVFCLMMLMIYCVGNAFEIVYPDFKASMLRETEKTSTKFIEREKRYHSFDNYYVNIFESIYNRNILEAKNSLSSHEYRIPRIIHQICLGKSVPEKFSKCMETWAHFEGWEYKLWTEEDIQELELYNQDLYNNSTRDAEKSDIARLEILSRYGGIYVDMDYECLKPEIFDELHRSFDFYIGFEPIECGKIYRFNMFKVCNGIIGAVPRHPLIEEMIINMKASYLAYQCCGVVERTGPAYYTRIMCEYAASEYMLDGPVVFRTMYLPSTFFYLFTAKDFTENDKSSLVESKLLPETAGVHHWDEAIFVPMD